MTTRFLLESAAAIRSTDLPQFREECRAVMDASTTRCGQTLALVAFTCVRPAPLRSYPFLKLPGCVPRVHDARFPASDPRALVRVRPLLDGSGIVVAVYVLTAPYTERRLTEACAAVANEHFTDPWAIIGRTVTIN